MDKKVNKTFTKPKRVEEVSLAKSGLRDEIKDGTSEDGCNSGRSDLEVDQIKDGTSEDGCNSGRSDLEVDQIKDGTSEDGCNFGRSDLEVDQGASSLESGHEVVCGTKRKEIERALGVDGEGLMVKKMTHEGSQVLNRSWSKGSSTSASDRDAVLVIYSTAAGAGENSDVLVERMHISWGRKAWCGAHLVWEKNTFGVEVSRERKALECGLGRAGAVAEAVAKREEEEEVEIAPPELAPEPPHAVTTPSSSPPFAAARNCRKTAMQPSSCSSRRDEAVAADLAAIGALMSTHAPPQSSPSTRVKSSHRRRKSCPLPPRHRAPLSTPANFPVSRRRPPPSPPWTFAVLRRRRPPPSPLLTVADDSTNSAESTQGVNSVDLGKPVGLVKSISGQSLTGLTLTSGLLMSLSVSSVIVPRLSRSGFVMFLPPPKFKPSFHEFYYERLCVENSWESLLDWGCSSLRSVDIGVTLGFGCQFLALLIISEMYQLGQLAYDVKTIYILRGVPLMLGGLICSETRKRWSYVFPMSSLRWIGCHDIEECWIV
uniref:Uncharacterized protein n=1 Tax=Brassica oleracea var. oleracea TaxID=109376 RepID=A0A0D3D4J4_BRAOL